MERDLLTDKLGSELEELSFSEWPDPPGSHPWLPAYGFLPPPQHALDKDDFMDPNDAALFLGCGLGVSAGVAAMGGAGPHGAHFLETIVEETSEQLRCEGASPRPYSWMDDSDQDSVIHVSSVKDDNDSGSERDFLCPAKRRRPNRLTDRASSPSDPDGDQLSRSSSLAQFESLEQSCQLLDSDSPQSLLSLDSLERLKPQLNSADVSPDSLENSSDSELHSSSSQESAYRILSKTESDHFNDRSLPEERFSDATYVVSGQNFDDEAQFWKDDNQKLSDEESNRSSSDFSSDSDKTVQEDVTVIPMRENVASKYNFKSCRSLDALPSLENLDATKIDQSSPSCAKPNCRNRQHVVNGQYSAENLSEDSGYSDHFCNFMRIRSKSNPSVNNAYSKSSLKRKSDDDLLSIFNSKCQRKGEMGCQFGAAGEFRRERSRNEGKSDAALKETKITKRQSVPRPSPSLPDLSADRVSAADYFDPIQARNTLPRKNNNKLINSDNFSSEDANLYSVSSVPKDLNLCEVEDQLDRSFDDNWSFGSERTVSVAAKNFDLCDFAYAKRSHTAVREAASFKQSFRVCESFTTSVADLTVLDYRTEPDGTVKNVMKKFTSSRTSTNSENMARSLPPTREWSAESDSTTESEKIFLNEMEKTMRQLNEQSKNILEKSLDHAGFDRNLSIMTNKRIHSPFNPFDEVIAELEKKQARSHAKNTMKEEPPKAMPEFEFNFYGEDEDPPYYRRHATYEASNSHTEDSSPDVSDSFNGENMFFHSTPMKGTDKVQSTPNLNLHHQDVEDIYSTVAPKEELRSSMQHVPNKNDFKPVGILGSKSQVLSGSASSKGVHFCPVVAEVSWRERSYSEDSTDISSNGSAYSNASCPEDSRFEIEGSPNIPALDILLRKDPETNNGATTKATTDAASVPLPAAVKYHHKMAAPRHNMAVPPPPPPLTPQTNKNISNSPPASARRIFDECACASRDKTTVKTMNESDKMEQNIQKQPSRSRIGGFLSKFASFRFSTRKSKKNDTTKTVNKTGEVNETQNKIGLKLNNHAENNLTAKQNVNNNSGGKINVCSDVATTQDYVYIPLKVETPSGGSGGSGGSGRPPLPPGKTPRSVEHHGKPQNHHIQRRATANGIDSNHWNEDGHHNLPGLLETDLDAVVAAPGAGGLSRSLLTLPPPHSAPRSHKSMEYLLDKENIRDVEPPENDLQKNSADRVLSEHQLRVQRSLQKLNLPDWYKNSPVQREGSLLKKRLSDAGCGWQAQSAAPAAGLSGKTTSLGSLGANHTGSTATVTTPIRREQGFTRWSTSRLNSHQTSPCSSARSSVRSGVSAYSPLPSPSRGPVRAPYLGWRSTERLAPLRTPHQRLAVSLLEANPSAAALPLSSSPPLAAASPATPDNVSSEIQEVTSAIVHYVTSQEEHNHKQQRPCWLESSFVGTKPLESPQTPVVVVGPPQAPAPRPPLQLELTHTRPTLSATSYQNEYSPSQHSLLNLSACRPSPGSTTLEDVLDSLLGLPSSAPRAAESTASPRSHSSPYTLLGLQSRYNERSNSQTSSLHFSLSSRTDDRSSEYRTASRISGDGDSLAGSPGNRRLSSDTILPEYRRVSGEYRRISGESGITEYRKITCETYGEDTNPDDKKYHLEEERYKKYANIEDDRYKKYTKEFDDDKFKKYNLDEEKYKNYSRISEEYDVNHSRKVDKNSYVPEYNRIIAESGFKGGRRSSEEFREGGGSGREPGEEERTQAEPDMTGADSEEVSLSSSLQSLPKTRASRAKSLTGSKPGSSRRQSEPNTSKKTVSLDRRVSCDSQLTKQDQNASKSSLNDLQHSKSSLRSVNSLNTDGSCDDNLVHCRYTKCTSATTQSEARRHYKSCHNCSYIYCSRECRRAHWEKHRKVCLHSRASTLCRQILSTAKEDVDSLNHVSNIALKGYSSLGRGVVKVFFTSPDAAEKFTTNGFQNLGDPIYVKWPDLMPNEMGPELYAELVKLCKSYNPETRLVLYVAVCIISEVPTKGAVVKWERQLVSRCAKLRLSKNLIGSLSNTNTNGTSLSPKAKVRSKDAKQREKIQRAENLETLILTSNLGKFSNRNCASLQRIRELSFKNIQAELHQRGVNLKRHFPEVYAKLCAYVDGISERFTPMTVYPRDNLTGKSFMCIIMPETDAEKFHMLPADSAACHTVDVSLEQSDQVSTPM